MLGEVNGIFLHLRRLLLIAGVSREGTAYRLSLMLVISTFIVIRIPAHIFLLARVYQDAAAFPSTFVFIVALSASILINLHNVALLRDVVKGDFFAPYNKKKEKVL